MSRALRRWWTQSSTDMLLASQEKLFHNLVKNCSVKIKPAGDHHGPLNSVEFTHNDNDSKESTERHKSPSQLPSSNQPTSAAAISTTTTTTLVLCHGFGSGAGFFFRNVEPLLQSGKIQRLLLVDWLGMGGSLRPSCHQRPIRGLTEWSSSFCESRFTPTQAAQFFIDPLDAWLADNVPQDENLWLLGHSLGGYLVSRYAVQYPRKISKLILASPVGFPPKPTNQTKGRDLPTSLRLIDGLWNSNITPQQLVRAMGGTRARRAVTSALRGRIPHLSSQPDGASDLLADYLYHITVADPSGEFAMNSLLEPAATPDSMGVYARQPLDMEMISPALDSVDSLRILFGDHDWMRFNEASAREVCQRLDQPASVDIVRNAGHHLYLDNPDEFCRLILD